MLFRLGVVMFMLHVYLAQQILPQGNWVDLSYDFSKETIYWPTAKGFDLKVDFEGDTGKGFYYMANQFSAAEHGGTHLDAPIHFAKNKLTIDKIPLDQLIGQAIIIDISDRAYEKSRL